jgi:hypothetical protein
MRDSLQRTAFAERLRMTAGDVPPEVTQARDEAAMQRARQFANEQAERPLAIEFLLREVAEKDDTLDGRFLTETLSRLADEVRVLLVRGTTRELALVLTKIQEAEHWAVEHGVKTNSHVVIDRRIFKTTHTEAQ